jgi:hypothetical protein
MTQIYDASTESWEEANAPVECKAEKTSANHDEKEAYVNYLLYEHRFRPAVSRSEKALFGDVLGFNLFK